MSQRRSASGVHRQWFGANASRNEAGASRREAIVLLHEGLGSLSTWGRFPALLAEACKRPVLAYDRRGYGRSPANRAPWPVEFMHLEARRLGHLLVEEEIDDPILVGHSDGATVALLYPNERSSTQPEPKAIVSLAAHLFVESVCVEEIEHLRAEQRAQLIRRLAPHHDHPAEVFEGWSEIWTSDRFRSWTIDDELRAVTCPVLAFQGEEDTYATRQQLVRMAAAVEGPISLVDLPDCDHWPHREATEQVLARIADFCSGLGTLPG